MNGKPSNSKKSPESESTAPEPAANRAVTPDESAPAGDAPVTPDESAPAGDPAVIQDESAPAAAASGAAYEAVIAEKMAAGLTRAQAIEVIDRQIQFDRTGKL